MKASCRVWWAVLIAAVEAGALSGCYYDPYLGYYHSGPSYPWGYGPYGYPYGYGYQPASPPPAAGTAPGPAGYGTPPQTPYGTAAPSPYSAAPPAAYGPERLTPYGAAPPANEPVQRAPLPPPPTQ